MVLCSPLSQCPPSRRMIILRQPQAYLLTGGLHTEVFLCCISISNQYIWGFLCPSLASKSFSWFMSQHQGVLQYAIRLFSTTLSFLMYEHVVKFDIIWWKIPGRMAQKSLENPVKFGIKINLSKDHFFSPLLSLSLFFYTSSQRIDFGYISSRTELR